MNAKMHNKELKLYYERKKLEGKPHFVIMNNISNKLLRIVYSVVKNEVKYDPNYICLDPRSIKKSASLFVFIRVYNSAPTRDEEQKREFVFLTNAMHISALQVAAQGLQKLSIIPFRDWSFEEPGFYKHQRTPASADFAKKLKEVYSTQSAWGDLLWEFSARKEWSSMKTYMPKDKKGIYE